MDNSKFIQKPWQWPEPLQTRISTKYIVIHHTAGPENQDVGAIWQEHVNIGDDGIAYTLIAGTLMGKTSPVPVYSKLYFLQMKCTQKQTVNIGADLYGEAGLYILEGSIESEGTTFGAKELLVAKNNQLCEFTMNANTTVYFFGGEPFAEERFIYWNFVSSRYDRIEQAKQQWLEQKFTPVPGETDFVPLPDESNHLKHRA